MWPYSSHPLDGTPLEVIDGLPETAGGMADPPEVPAVSSPGLHPGELAEVVQKLMRNM
jgi:Mn-containing catalase